MIPNSWAVDSEVLHVVVGGCFYNYLIPWVFCSQLYLFVETNYVGQSLLERGNGKKGASDEIP